MTASPAKQTELRKSGWLLWVALAVVWFGTTHLYPLFDPDEGRYAEIPREMLASGDWVTPRLDGLQYFEKPPLQYWATAILYKHFGLSEWTARAWSLGLAFLCLPLTFLWARRLFGPRAAWAALTVLASSPFFLVVGHLNLLDPAFTFWLTAALFTFTLAQAAAYQSRNELLWMLCAWLTAALAVLSKGIVVLVLTGLALLVYCLVQRDFQVCRRLHIAIGAPLFLLVTVPWFFAITLRHPAFPKFFFLHEHFARFLTTVHQRIEPWWFFLSIGTAALLPWLADLRGALQDAWRRSGAEPQFEPLKFLLIFAAVGLAFFSISQSKLPTYILPLMPPLAAIIGVRIAHRPESFRRAAWISLATVSTVAAWLFIDAMRSFDAMAVPFLTWGAVAVGVAMLAAFNIQLHWSVRRNAMVLAAGSMFAWQCLIVAYGAPPSGRSARALIDVVRSRIGKQSTLYSVDQYRQSVPPYLGRTLILVNYAGELEFGQHQEPGRNCLTLGEFKLQWQTRADAIAFFEPATWDRMTREGVPGRVIAADRDSIVVSRR